MNNSEERKLTQPYAEEEARDRNFLESAIDKVARKYERLAPESRHRQNDVISMKLTIGELRVLKQFHRKFFD